MNITINDKSPKVSPTAFVAHNSTIIGNVEIGEHAGIWFGAVIRADDHKIKIGDRTNIQDLSVVHVQHGFDTTIGDDVTVGHRAIVHGCHVGNRVLVGMGAIIMNGAVIGDDSIIGAGALVTEGTKIPPRSLFLGSPAKFKRGLTEEEVKLIKKSSEHYAKRADDYRSISS